MLVNYLRNFLRLFLQAANVCLDFNRRGSRRAPSCLIINFGLGGCGRGLWLYPHQRILSENKNLPVYCSRTYGKEFAGEDLCVAASVLRLSARNSTRYIRDNRTRNYNHTLAMTPRSVMMSASFSSILGSCQGITNPPIDLASTVIWRQASPEVS